MSGAYRTQQQASDDSDKSGVWRQRLEEVDMLKALIEELDNWHLEMSGSELDNERLNQFLYKTRTLLDEERDQIHSGKFLHMKVRSLAETSPSFASIESRIETIIVQGILGNLQLKHVTASEIESLRRVVVEPVTRLSIALTAQEREKWQVVEALCLIMDSRIHNEKDIFAKMDRMQVPQFDLTQQLLRRLLWDQIEYSQFRRVVYAFYIRLSSKQTKLGYGDFEYSEMLSYVYDFGHQNNVTYEFMAWKATNPIQLTPSFQQAIIYYFEFEGRGTLSDTKIRKILLTSNNPEFNALIQEIRLEHSGAVTRFMTKHWRKLTSSLLITAAVALVGLFVYKHWIK
ncbi:hypothetical protein [Cohnella yongneupensis]|uniref:Uncharacterized protein n=1 Tax=Cohnella yongneupensis TaxID=425006 RepID=A0ABW0R269_9BACL